MQEWWPHSHQLQGYVSSPPERWILPWSPRWILAPCLSAVLGITMTCTAGQCFMMHYYTVGVVYVSGTPFTCFDAKQYGKQYSIVSHHESVLWWLTKMSRGPYAGAPWQSSLGKFEGDKCVQVSCHHPVFLSQAHWCWWTLRKSTSQRRSSSWSVTLTMACQSWCLRTGTMWPSWRKSSSMMRTQGLHSSGIFENWLWTCHRET